MAVRKFSDAGSREAFWRGHVTRWASSGESIVAYCRARDLSEGNFHYWKSVLKRRNGLAGSVEDRPAFAEVQVTSPRNAGIEVSLGGTLRVQVHPGFDADTLARVIAVLERASW